MKTVNIEHKTGDHIHLVNLYDHPQQETEDTQFVCQDCNAVIATVYARQKVKPYQIPAGNYRGSGGISDPTWNNNNLFGAGGVGLFN